LLDETRDMESKISRLTGRPVAGLKMLEIGPGQQLLQLAYFGRNNEVVGIDLDVLLPVFSFRGCVRMLAQNGWLRTCKTIGRKLLGIDARIRAEVTSQLGLGALPELPVLRMDASIMQFPDDHFDVVFSKDVFEHLSDPEGAIGEISRVLKPGGTMFVRLHLFTSDSGGHDTRIFSGRRGGLPFWAHLRPEFGRQVRSNAYLNRLRLDDWVRLFESRMHRCAVVALCNAPTIDREELARLRSDGQLSNYSDEELLSVGVDAYWRKPASPLTAPCPGKAPAGP
jgi:SAM-dependent methyltransferase